MDDGSLFGNVRVNGYKAFAFYHFNDNKLHDGLYLFDLGYTSGGQFISTYNSLKESLTKNTEIQPMIKLYLIKKKV